MATSTLSRGHLLSTLLLILLQIERSTAFVPFIDGGKEMPSLYNAWLNGQIAKQVRLQVPRPQYTRSDCTRTELQVHRDHHWLWLFNLSQG
jgi:hypothetical protein